MIEPFSFGVIADCQYADKDNTEITVMGTEHKYYNYYRSSPAKLQEAVDKFNEHELEFVVHLGDFTEKDLDGFDKLANITKGLKVPLWHVLGNHEYWGNEGNEQRVLDTYGLKNSYYSKRINNFRFIILDTNEVGIIKHTPESEEWTRGRQVIDKMKQEGAINAYGWNGGVGEQQFSWLENELADAQTKGEKVILFAHHPVFPPGVLNALNSDALLALIDKYVDVVAAFINGHNHCGAFGVRKSIPYITVPGMLQGPINAFGVATVQSGQIKIAGYGRVEDTVIEMK